MKVKKQTLFYVFENQKYEKAKKKKIVYVYMCVKTFVGQKSSSLRPMQISAFLTTRVAPFWGSQGSEPQLYNNCNWNNYKYNNHIQNINKYSII